MILNGLIDNEPNQAANLTQQQIRIDFDFTGSNVTSLGPSEFVLVVRDEEAFEARYGNGISSKIAGSYDPTRLSDSESITLKFGTGVGVDETGFSTTIGFAAG